jgi:archaellum biogenesis protein FlaJ (TadC family)
MKGPRDPVDHARTTRTHAGESMTDNLIMPALVVTALGLVSFVAMLAAFATGHHATGAILAVLAAVGFVLAFSWMMIEHRRVRRLETRWYAEHPSAKWQPPCS